MQSLFAGWLILLLCAGLMVVDLPAQTPPETARVPGGLRGLCVIVLCQATNLTQPNSSLIFPVWMPVRVSYSFWVTVPTLPPLS